MKILLKREICGFVNSAWCAMISLKRVRKVKLCGYCAWTVAVSLTNVCKKKKKKCQMQTLGFSVQSKRILSLKIYLFIYLFIFAHE